ncbi:PIN domain-containing protein [Roseivirga ehrenbergii]|uniref:PIN domain-containing protein n=1 Tax=Roseivirga ehrenbergii (strain DSM 102268 / JCM 13514 / KCTC 12282 / NCIMB 14502 / KMM 6017) TaxID=279360 RepID=A0A150WZ44_ROSEK|nr:PIN domain-containing protein [Roseivirga ehrenbergii]KYG71760.1 hypothetical protein MB14_10620 [Roseivirga ehrenbergii]TCL07545.1 PIN domain-containing protein [Roseivirga ehrenbergii]
MKIELIKKFKPKASQVFFFDSNIWLYLLYPQGNLMAQSYIKTYSEFSDKILRNHCSVVTNIIQISEIINVVIKQEYNIYNRKGGELNFKNFRDSKEGKTSLIKAKTLIDQLIRITQIQSETLTDSEIRLIVNQCDCADFNDVYFAKFCEKQNAILVTHDFDFKALNHISITTLSANQKYFH